MASTVTLNDLMDFWGSDAVQTQPDYSSLTSHGYATNGDPVTGVPATMPGASWFNMISAMRTSLIRAAGETVAAQDPLQFLKVLQSLAWMKDKVIATSMLADALITTAQLANDAVVEKAIKNAAITRDKIKEGAVSFDRLDSEAIATLEAALAGIANNLLMTPYLVKQMLDQYIGALFPTGIYGYMDTEDVPSGWLLCNGAAVSRTTYAKLFAAIGTRNGVGDGSTTFNLPNAHGRVLQGTTNVADVGKLIEAGLPNITGAPGNIVGYTGEISSGAFSRTNSGSANLTSGNIITMATIDFDASRVSLVYGGSLTVQPASIQALIIIKD